MRLLKSFYELFLANSHVAYVSITASISKPGILSKKSHVALQVILDQAQLFLQLHPAKGSNELQKHLTEFHSSILMLFTANVPDTISYLKNLSTFFVEFIRGGKPVPTEFYWSEEAQAPFHLIPIIEFFRPLLDRKFEPEIWRLFQATYLVLSCHRVVMLSYPKGCPRPEVNIKSIITPSDKCRNGKLISLIPLALKRLGITPSSFIKRLIKEMVDFRPYIISTSGPNGQATWSGYFDAFAISRNRALLSAFDNFLSDWGETLPWPEGNVMMSMLLYVRRAAKEAVATLSPARLKTAVTSRLLAIPELGGKVRIVAIVDYWTQMLLTPLHNTIAHFLKGIEMDGTFDQLKVIQKLQSWTASSDKEIYSFDLTAATDRLPRWIQIEILSYLTTSVMATSWAKILTSRLFIKPGISKECVAGTPGTFVTYAVGQPMGAKTSFPMLALTHHVIVQIAHILTRPDNMEALFDEYVIVGDDNSLTNGRVADKYLYIMTRLLGMEISASKSFVHAEGTLPVGELCKRIFISGRELTALNPKLLTKIYFTPKLISDLQTTNDVRGRPILDENFFLFVAGAFSPKALRIILLLNSAPTEVSGLSYQIALPPDMPMLHDSYGVTVDDMIQAFIFASLVAQLKRFDQLVNATREINAALVRKSYAHMGLSGKNSWVQRIKPISPKLAAQLPKSGDPHPISLAANWEYWRINRQVENFRVGDIGFSRKAYKRLIDSLRNTLSTIWLDPVAGRRPNVADRTLFNHTMDVLRRVTISPSRSTYFEIYLHALSRKWSVTYGLGRNTRITPLSYNVAMTVRNADRRLHQLITDIEQRRISVTGVKV